jgi:hypothetical protein
MVTDFIDTENGRRIALIIQRRSIRIGKEHRHKT